MAILQLQLVSVGEVGVLPGTIKMVTSDDLTTITTAGYLNSSNLEGRPLSPADIIQAIYSFDRSSNSGTFGIFTIGISNAVITLTQWSTGGGGSVILPTTALDVAIFHDNIGTLYDPGITMSSTNKTIISMLNGVPVTTNNLAAFADTNGTIQDSLFTPSNQTGGTLAAVITPTVGGDLAVFSDTSGTIGESGNGVLRGTLQLGDDTVPGQLTVTPGVAASGTMNIIATTNIAGNFSVFLTNAASFGQDTTFSVPDFGVAANTLVVTDPNSGTQKLATGFLGLAAAGTVSAAGGGQGGATPLVNQVISVTTVTAPNDGVLLPVGSNGNFIFITNVDNVTSNTLDIYPGTGEQINQLGANNPYSLAVNKSVILFCPVVGSWYTLLTA